MSRMIMQRAAALTLRSLTGHTVRFEPNKPVSVPAELVSEAMERGAIPVDSEVKATPEVTKDVPAHPVGTDRVEMIRDALEAIRITNDRSDFTAAGAPNLKVVSKKLGFEVTSREVRPLWDEVVVAAKSED